MHEHIAEVFGDGLLSRVYFTESNPAKIETIDIKKEGDRISETSHVRELILKEVDISNSGNISLNIRDRVRQEFFSSLRFESDSKEMRYFNRGIKRIFFKRDPEILVEILHGFDWAIMPSRLLEEVEKASEYEVISGHGDIRLKGRIENTLIFKCDDVEEIFLGMKESIEIAFRDRLMYDEKDSSRSFIEMSIKIFGGLKKILVR